MKRTLARVWQWTWGFPQNLLGLLVFLTLRARGIRTEQGRKPCPKASFRHAAVTGWSRSSAMSLGMFLFVPDRTPFAPSPVWIHEFGHTVQSLILGPLWIPVVGIPSALWAGLFGKHRTRKRISYYRFYPERWANRLGERTTGERPPK